MIPLIKIDHVITCSLLDYQRYLCNALFALFSRRKKQNNSSLVFCLLFPALQRNAEPCLGMNIRSTRQNTTTLFKVRKKINSFNRSPFKWVFWKPLIGKWFNTNGRFGGQGTWVNSSVLKEGMTTCRTCLCHCSQEVFYSVTEYA